MDRDTDIGGPHDRFPETRRSALFAARDGTPEQRARAHAAIVEAYWKPAYKYLRLRWHLSNEDAKDLTQDFFARALEKEFFERYDHARAAFRTYLRTCLDGFAANQRKSAGRLKRGGAATIVPLDFESADGELRSMEIPDPAGLDAWFDREWMRGLFERAVESLRESCEARGKPILFRIFERYDLDSERPERSYAELASEFGLPVTTITNHLARARREFRRIVLDHLRDLTADEAEFRDEAHRLFGGDPG